MKITRDRYLLAAFSVQLLDNFFDFQRSVLNLLILVLFYPRCPLVDCPWGLTSDPVRRHMTV